MKKVLLLGFFFLISGIGNGVAASSFSQRVVIGAESTSTFKPYRVYIYGRCSLEGHWIPLDCDKEANGEETSIISGLLSQDASIVLKALQDLSDKWPDELLSEGAGPVMQTFQDLSDTLPDELLGKDGGVITRLLLNWLYRKVNIISALIEMVSCRDGSKDSRRFTFPDRFKHNWFCVTNSEGLDVTDKILGKMSVPIAVALVKRNYDFLGAQGVDDEILEICRTLMHALVPGYESLGLLPPREEFVVYENSVEKLIWPRIGLIMRQGPENRNALWLIFRLSPLCR